ncbi:UDP-N-acetylmuramate--L-alanine ligase [Winogradskyella sp. DF17]|uniref:UDP-N-acetylmuramate--L-alanine ligase n=1 Tax=Winogradskyella pelagia TaxID=2819984 RepID=A0ABS3SZ58_9FLAO|nr:UDP-N-acetylmuramate--L-alanine ligase [Winogradskyella sp. DF17]MBO3115754.1 UDP-N-acetylmuramate--L-alanine ligase [Winogradskyella sp. DF17]
MKVLESNNVYFIGIGGIGMSALARYFHANGKRVAGYDKTPSDITEDLSQLGIEIHFEDALDQINDTFLDSNQTLVVYTPAIPESHKQLNYFKSKGFTVVKRSFVLGEIANQSTCIAVAGTHGKTTTTSILGHLLYECDVPVTAFFGGISENYNTNFISKGTDVTVVEADEFDRSFLTLNPDIACITSMDADHLDIYGDADQLTSTFRAFSKQIKQEGVLFINNGLPLKGLTYGLEDDSDYRAEHIKIVDGSYIFDFRTPKGTYKNFQFNLPGRHNLSNAIIALAMAVTYGCPHQQLAKGLASYKGVKRRFTYHVKTNDTVLIDDYAHHPQEISAVYNALREMYGDKKLLAVFQPHLFSRTRDFIDGFAESLTKFDEIILLDIYPARELPIEGVSSAWLLNKIKNPNKQLVNKSELVAVIKESKADIILTIGAGDIGQEVKTIKKALTLAN